jgi:hypothetical protein
MVDLGNPANAGTRNSAKSAASAVSDRLPQRTVAQCSRSPDRQTPTSTPRGRTDGPSARKHRRRREDAGDVAEGISIKAGSDIIWTVLSGHVFEDLVDRDERRVVAAPPHPGRQEASNGLGHGAQVDAAITKSRSVSGLYAGTPPGCGSRPSCCSCPNTSTTSQCSVSLPFHRLSRSRAALRATAR